MDKDNKKSEQVWNEFINNLNTKLSDWKIKHPVNNYEYEFELFSTGHLRSASLHLKGEKHSTWVFEVSSFLRPQHETYFSSIVSDIDELEVASFDEVMLLIEQTFLINDFKEMVEELQNFSF